MENIIIVNFDVESEAYQALSELKKNAMCEGYVISQAVLTKNNDGKLLPLDGFDTGAETHNDTRMGGMIGALLGIAGGPLGMVIIFPTVLRAALLVISVNPRPESISVSSGYSLQSA